MVRGSRGGLGRARGRAGEDRRGGGRGSKQYRILQQTGSCRYGGLCTNSHDLSSGSNCRPSLGPRHEVLGETPEKQELRPVG